MESTPSPEQEEQTVLFNQEKKKGLKRLLLLPLWPAVVLVDVVQSSSRVRVRVLRYRSWSVTSIGGLLIRLPFQVNSVHGRGRLNHDDSVTMLPLVGAGFSCLHTEFGSLAWAGFTLLCFWPAHRIRNMQNANRDTHTYQELSWELLLVELMVMPGWVGTWMGEVPSLSSQLCLCLCKTLWRGPPQILHYSLKRQGPWQNLCYPQNNNNTLNNNELTAG